MNDAPNRSGNCNKLKFEQVLQKELEYFGKWPDPVDVDSDIVVECGSKAAEHRVNRAHKARLSGLAFSGGGIRSATFNLGVLQALARLGLIGRFDYLSTVSGGGYIGSWFAAWVHRVAPPKPDTSSEESNRDTAQEEQSGTSGETRQKPSISRLEQVAADLAASVSARDVEEPRAAMQPDPAPIWHLREYSNYLSPQRGLWSTDTWTLGITYLRNLLLTLSLLLATLIGLVLLTRLGTSVYFNIARGSYPAVTRFVPYAFGLCVFGASLLAGLELSGRSSQTSRQDTSYLAVAFAWLAAASGVLWLWLLRDADFTDISWWMFPLFIIPLIGWLIGYKLGGRSESSPGDGADGSKIHASGSRKWLWVGSPLLSTLTLIILIGLLYYWIGHWPLDEAQDYRRIVVWGIPLFVLIFSMVAVVFVGSASGELSELDREWLGRFFAALFQLTVLSTFLVVLVVYSSSWVAWLRGFDFAALTATTAWGTLSAAGAYLARNVVIGKSNLQGRLQKWLIIIAPYVFILGILILTTWVTEHSVNRLNIWIETFELPSSIDLFDFFLAIPIVHRDLMLEALLLAITVLLMFFWSWRVGVNRFSLHSMYADRLIRAYLGASNLKRNAHPFTGFDESDNEVHIHELREESRAGRAAHTCAPYLIINAAINLVSSKRLAWQKRKAASFTFTPLYCGYEFCGVRDKAGPVNGEHTQRIGGYVDSSCYAGEKGGVSLGKAMAISGAAASPNMGYHSSPALTFLMTTFNVRLGWWLPNTAKDDPRIMQTRGPAIGLIYLWFELLGKTNAERNYVYLSDGGHFENLGIYELVRRRCRIVVACDAEADPDMQFSGLGNAIEKCQIDLGVPIDIDLSQIRPDAETGQSQWHCAVGCIRYSEADKQQSDGTLIYLKASLTGDEPLNVETYARKYQAFPHQTTADQWFDESQFESYRALGEHITMQVFENATQIAEFRQDRKQSMLERVALEMRKQWYSGAASISRKPANHDSLLESIMDSLREDDKLCYLDGQLYPNLKKIEYRHFNDAENPPQKSAKKQPKYAKRHKSSLPADYPEFRAGFYFCKRLIQFMQQVYYDRRLDQEHEAPINRGWMNLFRRWSWSRMLRFTWTMTAGTYSARFQSFCEHRLGLHSGDPKFGKPLTIVATRAESSKQRNNDYGMNFYQVTADGKTKTINWRKVEHGKPGLHSYEIDLIKEFISTYVREIDKCLAREKRSDLDEEAHRFYVYSLKVETNDPVSGRDSKTMKLNAGFLIAGTARIESADKDQGAHYSRAGLYFRIRPSMRNMDLARKALLQSAKLEHAKKMQLVTLKAGRKTPRQRQFRDVYAMERQSLDRCRWFYELQGEIIDDDEFAEQPAGSSE